MPNQSIEFFVPGEPRAKQSFRVSGRGRGFTPARVKAWQADVGWVAQQMMRAKRMMDPLTGNLIVSLDFQLGNARRVDLDNLSKAVLDGLNGICWEDDRQVFALHLVKVVCEKSLAGVFVSIAQKELSK